LDCYGWGSIVGIVWCWSCCGQVLRSSGVGELWGGVGHGLWGGVCDGLWSHGDLLNGYSLLDSNALPDCGTGICDGPIDTNSWVEVLLQRK